MASSSSSPQERSIASSKLFDAFISHRGPDVKDTLAKQLYERLQERGCRTFLDREEIEGGESITSAIRNGIRSSVAQIAIFSKRYAESSWCLDELVLMLQQADALFIPVFYDVQPWELRHIENGNSQYAAAFSDYQRKGRNLDKLDEWKKALASAADISGYERRQNGEDLCEKIVSRVLQEMEKRIPLPVAKHPVALDELVQDFERSCSERAGMVGIFGLGGSGKTTLAIELFNRKRSDYAASCFLSDVRESQARGTLHCLQSQLLKNLFDEKDRVFNNVKEGIARLTHCLGRARARGLRFLVVLDDIEHQDQLDALLPEGMPSPGSLVIITTRDQSVLRGAHICYEMKKMDKDYSKELFCRHAFGGQDPPTAYERLVESFVEFCGGLPLSLIVLGAHVSRTDKHYWELELEKVQKIQPRDIMERLKISVDGLDKEEKQIFIDIACFFNKNHIYDMKRKAILVWNASGWSAEHAVQTLQDKCLVEVVEVYGGDGHGFEMHDHLRDLGRQMADELGPPRLWRPDILRSMEAKGFRQILAETKARCFHKYTDSYLERQITYFIGSSRDSAETNLLLLEINADYYRFPDYYRSRSIPSWIPLQKLHVLSVMGVEEFWSNFQQQLQINTQQVSFELRYLEIENTELPDLIMFSHLEDLCISSSLEQTDVTSFVKSLKQLSSLRSLKLSFVSFTGNLDLSKGRDSTNLEASTSSCMKNLETIKFDCLRGISKLVISGEMCPGLRSLEVHEMSTLQEMDLRQLKRLNTLEVWNCEKLETISGLPSPTALQGLTVELCSGLESLPLSAHLHHLKRMKIAGCDKLRSVGVEEMPELTSLEIQVPDDGYAWVRKCIYGLRRLPSQKTVLIGMPVDKANLVNLFSEVIGAGRVVEIEKGEYGKLEMRSSSSAITIYALLLPPCSFSCPFHLESQYIGFTSERIVEQPYSNSSGQMTIILLNQHNNSKGSLKGVTITPYILSYPKGVIISGGFKATINEGEEGKALSILQRIVDKSMVPKLAAYDVIKRKRKL